MRPGIVCWLQRAAGQRADGRCDKRPARVAQAVASAAPGGLLPGGSAGCHRVGHRAGGTNRAPERCGLRLPVHSARPHVENSRLAEHYCARGFPGHGGGPGRAGGPAEAGGSEIRPPVAGTGRTVAGAGRAASGGNARGAGSAAPGGLLGGRARTRRAVRRHHHGRASLSRRRHCDHRRRLGRARRADPGRHAADRPQAKAPTRRCEQARRYGWSVSTVRRARPRGFSGKPGRSQVPGAPSWWKDVCGVSRSPRRGTRPRSRPEPRPASPISLSSSRPRSPTLRPRPSCRESRARIVATADQTRQQIERDLHDGAQQRLVSLALQLRMAQAAVPPELGRTRRRPGARHRRADGRAGRTA